ERLEATRGWPRDRVAHTDEGVAREGGPFAISGRLQRRPRARADKTLDGTRRVARVRAPASEMAAKLPDPLLGSRGTPTKDGPVEDLDMYAVIRTGGKQYRVSEGQTLRV